MREYEKIKAVIMRGGTSKAVFIMENDLPRDSATRDKVILSIFGSPDIRQIDGLGGADPLTSKLAIIKPSLRNDADVDYTFAYIGINKAEIDYVGNCGNISSAVGPYAIDEGLVQAIEPYTTVKIYNTNTKKIILAEIHVRDGKALISGGYCIDGVPGTGAKISLSFPNAQGSLTGKLLPTGHLIDEIVLEDGRKIRTSMVDAAAPAIYIKAVDIGLTGAELPQDFVVNPKHLALVEEIRVKGAEIMGLIKYNNGLRIVSSAIPKVAIVGKAQSYKTISGTEVSESDIDMVARTKALGVIHKAYAITGGICTAAAAMIQGTVLNEVLSPEAIKNGVVRLGHPSGIMEFDVKIEGSSVDTFELTKATVGRTARRIMDGSVYIPSEIYWK
ncbi:MAG: hypothetical protein LBQ43_00465 [Holosporales bacterium]|jgi:2-methylaconitate cis-trans-isomerase PrpF|nr:hypothetical protein [Holosporales bacterium]